MGQYKVPQDVEAEDKLIGPLSLRQFIYVVVGLVWAGLMFLILRPNNSPSPAVNYTIMAILILPVTGFFLLLGFGRRKEQSFERYFAAVIRFWFVPRVRVWDKDLSTVELVKEEVKPPEVITEKNVPKSSLEQLALVMDTHGTMKDPTIQLQDEANQAAVYGQRVITPDQIAGNISNQARTLQVTTQDDVLDSQSARSAQVNQLLQNEEANIHEEALNKVRQSMQAPLAQPSNQTQPAISQPQTSSAILKKAMLQSDNLTVQQLANQANSQEMAEGQSIKISPNGN